MQAAGGSSRQQGQRALRRQFGFQRLQVFLVTFRVQVLEGALQHGHHRQALQRNPRQRPAQNGLQLVVAGQALEDLEQSGFGPLNQLVGQHLEVVVQESGPGAQPGQRSGVGKPGAGPQQFDHGLTGGQSAIQFELLVSQR